jgi:hypothetical protein
MAKRVQVSQVIDRPVDKVFHFIADEHVRNHPRWDPYMELEQESGGPIGLGTVIRRRNRRSGTPVEGTMEVVEFERDRVMSVVVHDGAVEIQASMTFEARGEGQTLITQILDLPGMDENADTSALLAALNRAGERRKQLIESEL